MALAGGVFANVKVNQKIAELENVEKVFIFPNMTATRYPLRLNDERAFYLIRGFYKL